MVKSTISMVIFNSYVSLPEGIYFDWIYSYQPPLSLVETSTYAVSVPIVGVEPPVCSCVKRSNPWMTHQFSY